MVYLRFSEDSDSIIDERIAVYSWNHTETEAAVWASQSCNVTAGGKYNYLCNVKGQANYKLC
jgi:hypothetical protein